MAQEIEGTVPHHRRHLTAGFGDASPGPALPGLRYDRDLQK